MEKLARISVCAFPGTVIFIDDKVGFAEGFQSQFANKFRVLPFMSALDALDFLEKKYDLIPIGQQLAATGRASDDTLTTELDLRRISEHVYNNKRFDEIMTVVVDFAMEDMDGLVFARKLRQLHKGQAIRIIMLTGEAGHALAVEAFNEGSIDQFILKNTTDLANVVAASISRQQAIYFEKQSDILLNNAREQVLLLEPSLRDPDVVSLFQRCCADTHAIEHYLLSDEGGFLMLNDKGAGSFLLINEEKTLDDYYEIAHHGGAVPDFVLGALKNHTHMPLFYRDEDLRVPPSNWRPYLHPATRLVGSTGIYYYSVLPHAEQYRLKQDAITSYDHYLRQQR